MAKTILEEAMEDTKLLKETAIQNARNILIEAISPQIKQFVESQLGETALEEDPTAQMGVPMEMEASEDEFDMEPAEDMEGSEDEEKEEEEDDTEEDLNLIKKVVDKGVEAVKAEHGGTGVEEESLELEAKDETEGEEEEMDEVVEITNEDLKKALSEVLGSMKNIKEATVSKSFGDVEDPTPKTCGGKGQTGIADEKSGEHQWIDEKAPHAQDWTVKEANYRKVIEALTKENKEYKQACQFLKRNLQEVNLFNSKLLYTNKLLHSTELNNKQRVGVIEAFDRAQSLREVELVYKSISESLKIAGSLSESKQGMRSSMKGPKASRTTLPSSTVLNESVERNDEDRGVARWQELAGLIE